MPGFTVECCPFEVLQQMNIVCMYLYFNSNINETTFWATILQLKTYNCISPMEAHKLGDDVCYILWADLTLPRKVHLTQLKCCYIRPRVGLTLPCRKELTHL